jgi:hypothetical protein
MLIDNINTLRPIIPTIVGVDFSKYEPYLITADEWLTRELTGSVLFGKIKAIGNEELLRLAQAVVAHKAYFDAIPFLDLIETENGFGVVSNNNIAPASQARVQALQKQTEIRLSDSCESLIRFLEEKDTYHEDWKSSPAFSIISDCFIYTLDQFRRYAPFVGTRLDFIKAKPIMLKVQKLKIENVISPELSNDIILKLKTGELSAPYLAIIDYLRFAQAFFTIDDVQYKALLNNNPYELKALESIESEKSGQSFLFQVRSIIISKINDYPKFKESALYAQYLANTKAFSSDDPFLATGV